MEWHFKNNGFVVLCSAILLAPSLALARSLALGTQWVQVRKTTAEKVYLALMALEPFCEQDKLDEAQALLTDTVWCAFFLDLMLAFMALMLPFMA